MAAGRPRDARIDPIFKQNYLESCQTLIDSSHNHTIEVSKEKMKFGNELVRIDSADGPWWLAAGVKPEGVQLLSENTPKLPKA